jgi:hypothetical protein
MDLSQRRWKPWRLRSNQISVELDKSNYEIKMGAIQEVEAEQRERKLTIFDVTNLRFGNSALSTKSTYAVILTFL